MKVILDTNFIMEIARNKIDFRQELKRILDVDYEIYVMEGSIRELEGIIKNQKGKERETARLGLSLIKNIKTVDIEGKTVDDKIANIAGEDVLIATQDKVLKKRIKGKIIVVRQNKYLGLL